MPSGDRQTHAQRPSVAADRLDLLTEAMTGAGGPERSGGAFTVASAWSLASFGGHRLRQGWWRLDCKGEGVCDTAEVRLSSSHDPLIVFPASRAGGYGIRLRGSQIYDIDLLVSAWPGRFAFSSLQLRRLTLPEVTALLASALARVLGGAKPLSRIVRAALRLVSGESVGVRAPGQAPPAEGATRDAAGVSAVASDTVVLSRLDDICVLTFEGDVLDPRAPDVVRAAFAADPAARAFYADAVEGGDIRPKPGWDDELARAIDFAGCPVFIRADAYEPGQPPFDALRSIARLHGPSAVGRIALPLVRRPARALSPIAVPPTPPAGASPRVSVIIPTRNRMDLLNRCLDSLANRTDYPDVEVVIVDNGADPAALANVLGRHASLAIAHLQDHAPFNFARLVNAGAVQSSGEVLLFLNDDVEATQPDWLQRLVASALRPEIGAVGARLVYPDGTLQHGGVVLGPGGTSVHIWKGLSPEAAQAMPQIALPGQRLAVTGACLAVRRTLFDQVGGMDAAAFAISFNDLDFCLRLRAAGHQTLYRGDVILVHHESQSRGQDSVSLHSRLRLAGETAEFRSRWKHLIGADPFGSPAFDPQAESGAVHPAVWVQPRRS